MASATGWQPPASAGQKRLTEGRHTGLPINFDFRDTLELILQLQPDTKEVVCVAGTASFDRLWAEQCRLVLEGYRARVRYRFIGEGPLAETLSLVHGLPANSVVLYIDLLKDGRGQSLVPFEVLAQVVQQSSVAVYSLAAHHLAQGIVGGSLFDFGSHGRQTGQLCQKILADGRLDPGPLQLAPPDALMVNWRALKRWRISQSRVLPDAIVFFQPLSLWGQYRGAVLGAIAVTIVEAALIVVLFRSLTGQRRIRRALLDRLALNGLSLPWRRGSSMSGPKRWIPKLRGRSVKLLKRRGLTVVPFLNSIRALAFA